MAVSSRVRVMFIAAFTSSSARLGLLTVPSYKKFLVANALVAFSDVQIFYAVVGLIGSVAISAS